MPTQPKDTPIIQKPTPVALDELLIEQTDSNKALYDRQFEYGHLHPNRRLYPGYRFLKAEATEYGSMRYYWANDFSAQDAYNASKTFSGDSNNYPIFTRSYRVLRSLYLANGPTTKLTPFTGIITTKITNAGSGYTKDFAVTFTGAGSGAAGIAIVDTAAGTVIYIALTNVGTGYTSAPTVVLSAGDGTGAAATAYIQPQTALLVKEDHGKLDDGDPFSSLYDRVVMRWETLPGPTIFIPGWNAEYNAKTGEFRTRVALPATPDVQGDVIVSPLGDSLVIITSTVEPDNGSTVVGTKVTQTMAVPPSRTEHDSIGYEFPAQFVFITGWIIPVTPGFNTTGPYPGVNFTITAHRTLSTPASVAITYSNGPTGLSGVTIWRVDTPGVADRFFNGNIRANTIHNAIFVQETNSLGATQTVESLPASTPSSYTPGATLTIRAGERKIMGTLYEQRITTCEE